MATDVGSFHLDTLRVPKLVPHPALQPGAEVVDPSKGKRRFPRARRARIRPSGDGFRGVSGPRPKGKILESENANGPLRGRPGPPEDAGRPPESIPARPPSRWIDFPVVP